MAASRKRRAREIDERTSTMSVEALTCRSWGHSKVMVPTPAAERKKYTARGQRLVMIRCPRCTYCRDIVVDFFSGEQISAKAWYERGGKDYLVQTPGSGRLPQSAARSALFAQEDRG
jgi:hypothetical protein